MFIEFPGGIVQGEMPPLWVIGAEGDGQLGEEAFMTKLKLGAIEDDRPVKVTVELTASTHRDLLTYAKLWAREPVKPAWSPAS